MRHAIVADLGIEQNQVRELRQLAHRGHAFVANSRGALQVERLQLRQRGELCQSGVGDERILQLQLGELFELREMFDAGIGDLRTP